MSAEIINGKKIAQDIKDELKAKVESENLQKRIDVIIVGEDPASQVYVRNKEKACEYIGIKSKTHIISSDISEEELIKIIKGLNITPQSSGILVQLPLPDHIREKEVLNSIACDKDVDGFNPINVGNLSIDEKGFVSCTPTGIIELLKRSNIKIDGKNCVIIGRSNIVGKPMAMLMLKENATVTVCHSHTKNLKQITKTADILIVAIGQPKMITSDYVKEGAVVIDVGIHRMNNGKLCGDVDFESVSEIASKITPVPDGVGPMTIAMLMKNVVEGYK